jgi:ABC-type phosphate transport system substrate-binding protein
MSRHHHKRRLASLAACVGSTAALAALAAAGPAAASVTCGTVGYASGSSLQSTAMSSVFLTSTGWGSHSSCSPAPTSKTITYSKTSSGAGLEEFGDTGEPAGVFHPESDETAFKSKEAGIIDDVGGEDLDWFVGSDDPPSQGELSEAQAATGAAHLAQITIPVAQAPVATLLSLPAECLIPTGSKVDLPNKVIGQLWEGTNAASGKDPGGIQAQGGYAAGTWGAFLTQLGYTKTATNPPTVAGTFFDGGGAEGCGAAIKPQVRSVASGTSYAFKTYLSQVNGSVWNEFANDYTDWPTASVVESDPLSKGPGEQTNESGGKLAANTAATPGSVGYAAAADAVGNGSFSNAATLSTFGTGGGTSASHEILWAEVQNNGTGSVGSYADPLVGSAANCESTKLLPSDKGIPYSYTDSWAGVVASDPNIATDAEPTDYSICALTYDLVWHHYSNVNLYGQTEAAHTVANTVKDLFEYIIGAGQTEIQSHDYTRFPTGFAAHIKLAVSPGIGY